MMKLQDEIKKGNMIVKQTDGRSLANIRTYLPGSGTRPFNQITSYLTSQGEVVNTLQEEKVTFVRLCFSPNIYTMIRRSC